MLLCQAWQATQAHRRGSEALSCQNYREAEKLLNNALALYSALESPNSSWNDHMVDALVKRCSALAHLGKFQEALADAEQTIECRPKLLIGYQQKAKLLCNLEQFTEAREFLQSAAQTAFRSNSSEHKGLLGQARLVPELEQERQEQYQNLRKEAEKFVQQVEEFLTEQGENEASQIEAFFPSFVDLQRLLSPGGQFHYYPLLQDLTEALSCARQQVRSVVTI
mmetsp:Transcript_18340/g.35910  ORF Transcript_18340/g.35910 Transcript_18340/m.35910 type:complete len:223 (+) Transcript_18340:27-695(+)